MPQQHTGRDVTSAFNNYMANIADINKVDFKVVSSGRRFNVHIDTQVSFVNRLSEVDPFLKTIDMGLCNDQIINEFDVSELGLISKRTNTKKNERKPTEIGGTTKYEYQARKVEFDIRMRWETLDNWNTENRKEFNLRIRDRKLEAKANNITLIGWYGKKWAEETDPVENPEGQDVNRGWLQCVREYHPEKVMDKHPETGEPITIGKNGTYKKVDVLVDQMKRSLPRAYRDKAVVYISDDLVDARQKQVIEDTVGHQVDEVRYRLFPIGGLRAETPPNFPDGTILVTFPKNLKFRAQKGTQRSYIKDRPEVDAVDEFNSANELYGIGDYDAIAMAENITVADDDSGNEEGA